MARWKTNLMKYLTSLGLTLVALLGTSVPTPAAPAIPTVVVATTADGALLIEGRKYTTAAAYEAKIAEIEHRQPRPNLVASVKDWRDMKRMINIFQAMGVPKVGFLVEPKSN